MDTQVLLGFEEIHRTRSFPPLIKWAGSKRSQARQIVQLFPDDYRRYYEPFVGGGSILFQGAVSSAICGDICIPLIDLWKLIQKAPWDLLDRYRVLWRRLQSEGHTVYYEIRERFNRTQAPSDLFFLSRTCVNGLIRFNQRGEFNNSLHHTRRGITPDALERVIALWLPRIRNVEFIAGDYEYTLSTATRGDFAYLDPPYFHTRGRYNGRIDYERFFGVVEGLRRREVRFALSFDGSRGNTRYPVEVPGSIYERRVEIESGYSSFRKVMGGSCEMVRETVYLSW